MATDNISGDGITSYTIHDPVHYTTLLNQLHQIEADPHDCSDLVSGSSACLVSN